MSLDRLCRLAFGHVEAQVVYTAVRLGVPDALAVDPCPAAALASRLGCDATTLGRLLRALVVLGLVAEVEPDRYVLAAGAQELRADHPSSLRAPILLQGHPAVWQTWGGLADAVRSGTTAFDGVHDTSLFDHLDRDPELAAVFDAAMDGGSRSLAEAVVLMHDFAGCRTVVDVGGGRGALLARILQGVPGAAGILLDRPHAVADAVATFRAAGVADRAEARPGDFFTAVPRGDVLLVQGVLHDWDDERCLTVLRNCRRALASDGRLLVLEPVLPVQLTAPDAGSVVMSDLAMLVYTGGRERTRADYAGLLAGGGFALAHVSAPLPGSATRILVGVPVGA